MAECGCAPTAVETPDQRRVLRIALSLNVTMFLVGMAAGIVARSSGLIADSLDMLADAIAYAVALAAASRTAMFKVSAARTSGLVLLALGIGVLADVVRRLLTGEAPEGWIMIAVASVAFAVNSQVLRLLKKHGSKEVHVRATMTFTQVDVIANVAVVISGIIVIATGFRFVDLAVGAAIGVYVVKEALEIIAEAREARTAAQRGG